MRQLDKMLSRGGLLSYNDAIVEYLSDVSISQRILPLFNASFEWVGVMPLSALRTCLNMLLFVPVSSIARESCLCDVGIDNCRRKCRSLQNLAGSSHVLIVKISEEFRQISRLK